MQLDPRKWLFKRSFLLSLLSVVWLMIGIMLLNLGITFIVECIQKADLAKETPLFTFFASFALSSENCAIALLTLGIAIGYIKGNTVMKKAAARNNLRISNLPLYNPLHNLYTRNDLFLILFMMMLGMLMKFLQISLDIRGLVDTAVGTALIQGGMHELRFAREARKQEQES